MSQSYRKCFFLIAFVYLFAASVSSIQALDSSGCTATYLPYADDTQPRVMQLAGCAFFPAGVTVTVYDRDGDMNADGNWENNLDFDSDLYLFDINSDGTYELALDFYKKEDLFTVDIYDNHTGNGLTGNFTDDVPVLIGNWTVRMTSKDAWIVDGKPSFNLDVLVNGPIQAVHGATPKFEYDDVIDFETKVIDEDNDHRPDYQLTQVLVPEVYSSYGYIRTWLIHAMQPVKPISDGWLWPYLGSGNEDWVQNAFAPMHAPIRIDWSTGKVLGVLQFVPSHAGDHTYYIQSIYPFGREPGQTTANFENPYGFFDLAGDNDGQAELVVRYQYRPAESIYGNDPSRLPWIQVRYSWMQYDDTPDLTWDYSLSLIGNYAVDQRLDIPVLNVSVDTINYDDMPYWATEKPWNTAYFTAAENNGYFSSEGIYEGDDLKQTEYINYVRGWSDVEPPSVLPTSLRKGTRGEYTLHLQAQPYLYFSPIDQRLHLLNAERGLWLVDDTHRIVYNNLDHDSYLESWTYVEVPRVDASQEANAIPAPLTTDVSVQEDATADDLKNAHVLQRLVMMDDLFVYATENEIHLKKVATPLALFETLPPRNPTERAQLISELPPRESLSLPVDFATLFASTVTTQEQDITGGTISEVQYTPQGWHFLLELQANHTLSGFPFIAESEGEGFFYVTYNKSTGLTIKPATPAQAAIQYVSQDSPDQPIVINTLTNLKFNVSNEGSAPLRNVELFVSDIESKRVVYQSDFAAIKGHSTIPVSAVWLPTRTGQYTLRVELRDKQSGAVLFATDTQLDILPGTNISLTNKVTGIGGLSLLPILVIMSSFVIFSLIVLLNLANALYKDVGVEGK